MDNIAYSLILSVPYVRIVSVAPTAIPMINLRHAMYVRRVDSPSKVQIVALHVLKDHMLRKDLLRALPVLMGNSLALALVLVHRRHHAMLLHLHPRAYPPIFLLLCRHLYPLPLRPLALQAYQLFGPLLHRQ